MTQNFDRKQAFSRTIGWMTEAELDLLGEKRAAIAGLGGVGGSHVLTLARLGIGGLNLADMDDFGLENMNRQAGAFCSTIGKPKLDVLAAKALDINPALSVRGFSEGVQPDNLQTFLQDVDVYVDGLDFFSLDIRRRTFAECARMNIPAVTAAPLGMGTALLTFVPGGMTFDEYFQLEGQPEDEQYLRFLLGLSPAMLQMKYLVAPEAVDLPAKRGPSTVIACELCAAVAATQVVKLLLGRGKVLAAPHGLHFDAYRNRLKRTWRPFGNANPLQQAALSVARKRFAIERARGLALAPSDTSDDSVRQILDLARWAPSGDNAQPWAFDIRSDEHVRIRLRIDNENPYEYSDGRPTLLSGGFLLETLRLAARSHGRRMTWRLVDASATERVIDVDLPRDETPTEDELAGFIVKRSVDRRPYRLAPLTDEQTLALEQALGGKLSVEWSRSLRARSNWARINGIATHIRLSLPETFAVHQRIIDWDRPFSASGVPGAAIGADPALLRTMRWALTTWPRADRLNRYAMGTLAPRMELDWVPGIFCSAHFAVVSREPLELNGQDNDPALLEAGMHLQRFWLTATRLGLVMQPSLAPLAFDYYARHPAALPMSDRLRKQCGRISGALSDLLESDPTRLVFAGRIGQPSRRSMARSVRKPLHELMPASDQRPPV